ncbi:MAG: hypothetical protein MI724_20320 [Spirochaetales bacterium]|nr:hypothetical protein [Spirochaetales bacterium]
MSIAQKEREERAAYRKMLPSIVEALIETAEPVALSARIAEESGVDQRAAYRWIQLTEEALETRRKRDAMLVVAALWLGTLSVIAMGIGRIAMRFAPGAGVSVAVVGAAAVLIAFAVFRLRNLKMRSYRRWLRDELAEDEVEGAR